MRDTQVRGHAVRQRWVARPLERSKLTGRGVKYSPNGVVFFIRRGKYKGGKIKNMQLNETHLSLI